MIFKEYQNFVPEWLHKRVTEQLTSPELDWHFPGYGGSNSDLSKACFQKEFYSPQRGFDFRGTESLLYVLDYFLYENGDWFEMTDVHRCLANMYAPGQNTGWHYDHVAEGYYSLLYYVGESDGGTEFKHRMVEHEDNKAVFFKSDIQHNAIPSTSPRRISVNWILKGRVK